MPDTANPRNLDFRSGSCGPGDDWGRHETDSRALFTCHNAEEFTAAYARIEQVTDLLREQVSCDMRELLDPDTLDKPQFTGREVLMYIAYAVNGFLHDCSNEVGDDVLSGITHQALEQAVAEEAALSTAEAEKEALLLRDVDDGIDVANEAAATINARLARLGLRLTEPAIEALWRAVGGLDVVEVEDQADG